MGAHYMNGSAQAATAPSGLPQIPTMPMGSFPAADGAPLLTINQIQLSSGQIRWIMGAVIAALGALGSAGYLFMPAKDVELKALNAVVETIKDESRQQRETITRLTVAVERITEVVAELRDKPEPAPQVIQIPPAPAPRTAARPRPKPALQSQAQ